MMKLVLWLLMFLLGLSSAFAVDFYIDEEITVLPDGRAFVEGSTNLNILGDLKPIKEEIKGYSNELTNKKGKFWIFSYQSLKNVSDAIIYLKFPKNTEITQVASTLKDSFSSENDRPVLTFKGDNTPLNIKVKYFFKQEKSSFNFWHAIIFLVVIVIILFLFRKKKKTRKLDEEKLKTIRLTLNENQLKILDALINKGGEASQTQLKYLTDVPKSSLSRNIELMAQKNVISKFYSGTSNYIKLHPSLYTNSS